MQVTSAQQFPLVFPAAIFPARLEWLCRPEQIEHTLRLLYYLNGWKKANRQLLYADRQGLYEAQSLVLEQAAKVGMIQPVMYIDRRYRFPGELLLESVAANAARGVLISVRDMADPDILLPFPLEGSERYQHFIRPFYKHVTGKDFTLVADAVGAVSFELLRDSIQEELQKLLEKARATRKPLPLSHLKALCIAPVDLLHIRSNRLYFMDGFECWEDLDISDQRKLDPEGFSEIAFQYTSVTADFIFHLPFRWAETFMPDACLAALQRVPGVSQERGTYGQKTLDEGEGLTHPVREILQDLGINIESICPHKLLDKQLYLAKPGIRDILWPACGHDNEDWDEDPWDGICLPPDSLEI